MLQGSHDVHVEYEVEVSEILSPEKVKTMAYKTVQLKTVADREVSEGMNFMNNSCDMCNYVCF